MKARHAVWLLAYPFYQVAGTARHEWSHALAAILQGARVTEVHILPSYAADKGWLWGSVRYTGGVTGWVVSAAPYPCDLIVYALTAWILHQYPRLPGWAKANLFILGILSPWLDLAYNYQKVFTRGNGDVVNLMRAVDPVSVHAMFAVALLFLGAWAVGFFRSHLLRT